jgi:hypothetical protein
MSQPKRVRYKRSLACHLDLLGLRELIRTRKPGEVSKMLRLFSDAFKPLSRGIEVKALGTKQFVSFSDLHITVIPRGHRIRLSSESEE